MAIISDVQVVFVGLRLPHGDQRETNSRSLVLLTRHATCYETRDSVTL